MRAGEDMLICGCMKSMVWFPHFRLSLVAVRTAPISGGVSILNHKLSKGCFNEIYSLTQMITLQYTYVTYVYTYKQSFSYFVTQPPFDETFSITHKSIGQLCCSSQKQPHGLKCEDDNGTCHGQWFGEPCRLRLGRGSV